MLFGVCDFWWVAQVTIDGPTPIPTWPALTRLRGLLIIIIIIIIIVIATIIIKDVIKSREVRLVGPTESCREVVEWIRAKYIIYMCKLSKN